MSLNSFWIAEILKFSVDEQIIVRKFLITII